MHEITLTKSLVDQVVAELRKHEPMCEDRLVASQYLIAVVGYILASQGGDRRVLEEMTAFLHHVYDDLRGSQAPSDPPPEAFGIWKPE